MATIRINGRNVIHIDAETGEIIAMTEDCTEITDGKLTEKQKKHIEYLKTHDIKFNKEAGFVKMYVDTVYKLAKKLSPKEFTVAMALAKYVDFETCVLKFGYGKGKHDMTIQEMADELDIEYTRMTRIINKLIDNGVIGEFKTGNITGKQIKKFKKTKKYVVNPYIYIHGANPELYVVYHFFTNTGWKEFIESDNNVIEIIDENNKTIR